jgi:DNA polymerase-3 subunit alpha
MNPAFVHLNIHSEYSLVDGLSRVKALVNEVAEDNMPAMALTEQSNMFSVVKFYRAAQESGVKPIVGTEIRLLNDTNAKGYSRLILLCQNIDGYKNLARLLTRSYMECQSQGISYVPKCWLKEYCANLIALSGGKDGDIGQAIVSGSHENASKLLDEWQLLFPDRFYFELQRTNRAHEEGYNYSAIELAEQNDIPVVASNDVRFLSKHDYEAHEARVCIQQGCTLNDSRRPHHYSVQQYLRNSEEMQKLFEDIPEAIENTWIIAKRCNLELTLGENYLPRFPLSENYGQDEWLCKKAKEGLEKKIKISRANSQEKLCEQYKQRLETELDVIVEMGFSGYFLIVADFIQWAKDNSIPVGPGRGSGAGSLVAYVLGITELDPLEYDLLFERFLNPERISLPDFDIDFCMERRDEVIAYVSQRYGSNHVSQIITFGSMAAKAVVRDVGRVLGYPYGFVDQIAKLIPFDLNMTLDKALEEDDTLRKRYHNEDEVNTLINFAKKLEGVVRNAGRHAGGIVIAPESLTNYMPLYCEQGSVSTVTQLDMGDVEDIGLVKFDFLGLRTLTIIDWAFKDINSRCGKDEEHLDILSIPLDDKQTYKLIRRTETTAIFQLESDGMKKLIKRLQPNTFDDLIALVALFRPGPLQSGMVDDYVDRKNGRASIKHLHPKLEQIMMPTYGVILYQEQVMQIAQILAGYTLGAADLLRRAMGKKKPEEMAKQREIFTEGAIANNINLREATYIFDLMEKFAGYGFNKSHSAAYALIAYQTAWLKTHHPAAFMAAVLSSDMDNTDKVITLLEELRCMHIKLQPPSINRSMFRFTVKDAKTIHYGLGAIKGVGGAAIDNILLERNKNSEFKDLFDLCRRIDTRKVNRRVIEALIRAGALDGLGPSRSSMIVTLEKAMHFSDQFNRNSDSGQDDLFGFSDNKSISEDKDMNGFSGFIETPDWSEEERLLGEKETLGYYLEGHPIIRYEKELNELVTKKLKEIKVGNVTVAGYIHRIRTRTGRHGRMAEIRLDDRTAHAHLTVYSDKFEQYRNLLIKDQLIIVKGEVVADDFIESGYSITAKEIYNIEQARGQFAYLKLNIETSNSDKYIINQLSDMLKPYRNGSSKVQIAYKNGKASCMLNLGENWNINMKDELLDILRKSLGDENVMVKYH